MSKLDELIADLKLCTDHLGLVRNQLTTELERLKAARGQMNLAIGNVKYLRAEIKKERSLESVVRSDYRAAKIEKAKANAADRIARMEAKLAALKARNMLPNVIQKAAKKPSKVTYISKDIAA